MPAEWVEYIDRAPTDTGGTYEYLHWADVALADAWFAEANQRFGQERSIEPLPYSQQAKLVLEAWQALGNGYRAANVPPYNDPGLLAIMERWIGGLTARTEADAVTQVIKDSFQSSRANNTMGARMRDAWRQVGGNDLDGPGMLCGVYARVILGSSGELAAWCYQSNTDPAGCGPAGTSSGCAQILASGSVWPHCSPADVPSAPRGPREDYSWRTLAWKNPPRIALGAASEWCEVTEATLPLLWYYELGRELARSAYERGARRIIRQSRLYVVAHNAATMAAQGLLTLDELITRAASVSTDVHKFGRDDPQVMMIAAGLATAAAASASIPVVGPYAAAILGIAAAIAPLAPLALGYNVDRWGRAEPVYLRGSITGDITTSGRPTHTVPDVVAQTPVGVPPAPPSSSGEPAKANEGSSSSSSSSSTPLNLAPPPGLRLPSRSEITATPPTITPPPPGAFAGGDVTKPPPPPGFGADGQPITSPGPVPPVAPEASAPFYQTPLGVSLIAIGVGAVLDQVVRT